MPQFFRFIAFFAFGAGILGGLGLIGSAQPESTYGDVNTIRVIYGVVVLLTGLIWAMTWWALAELVEMVRSIAGAVGVGNPEPERQKTESPDRSQTEQVVCGTCHASHPKGTKECSRCGTPLAV